MKEDTKDYLRIAGAILLFLLSCAAFYYSMFWGWASGAGSVKQPALKTASNVALAVSFLSFWASVGIWLVPYFLKRRKKKSGSSAAHAS
jgi:uncharacterized membrane protein YwaF